MQDLIPLNIVIADRTYRIKTSVADEEIIRHTLKTINQKIVEYKTQFAGKDMQDYVAMVLIWYATQPNTTGYQSVTHTHQIEQALIHLEEQLSKALK